MNKPLIGPESALKCAEWGNLPPQPPKNEEIVETFRMIVLLAWGLVVVGMGVRFIWLSITDIRAAWKMLGFAFLAVIFWFILAVITALLTR